LSRPAKALIVVVAIGMAAFVALFIFALAIAVIVVLEGAPCSGGGTCGAPPRTPTTTEATSTEACPTGIGTGGVGSPARTNMLCRPGPGLSLVLSEIPHAADPLPIVSGIGSDAPLRRW
jgi:hypothetical protein